MEILEPCDSTVVQYHSSIEQHRGKLSVYKGGQWVPIVFDEIDYISCKDGIVSHRACVTDKNDLGYIFPTDTARYTYDMYVYHDEQGVELHELPEWFGAGFYKKYIDNYIFTNADNCSLGTRNTIEYAVGLDYALADNTLEAADNVL